MARIGFIGLGNMGLPMAQNLLKAGHHVEGVDVNPASVEKLKAAGGAGVETAKSAAARATSSSQCCRQARKCAKSILVLPELSKMPTPAPC
jgi:3-hydroxyisobutyrate dehydrogenase-like beta-hydroxyacid dehydrogenase